MPVSTFNLQWNNHNSVRAYPLDADGTRLDDSGSFRIPDDFILGLDLPIQASADVLPGRFFIRSIGAFTTGYSVVVGYQPVSGNPINAASALIPRQVHVRNTVYALGGVAPFDDTMGKILIGKLDNIDEEPAGMWTFSLETARLESDAIRPMLRGVSGIVCVNGDQRSSPLRGIIELVAGNNMQLVPITVSGSDPVIRLNAIDGEGTVETCVCEGDTTLTDPVKSFNGIAPTAAGDFTVIGSDCIEIEPIENGVRIVDTCSKPCCGCPELERITQDLERLGQQQATVQSFVDRLQESVNTMSLTVLGARLGDKSCSSCE